MKLFDIGWLDFFRRLGVWDRLALSTRQVLAQLKPNKGADLNEFGDDLQLLIDEEFVVLFVDGKRAKLHKKCFSFARAIRAMCRHDVLEQPDAAVLKDYLRDHYTQAEQAALMPDGRGYNRNADDLIRNARSAAWLNDFLSLESFEQAQAWESERQENSYHYRSAPEEPILDRGEALAASQSIIRQFMSSTDPVSFSELSVRFKNLSTSTLAAATYAGIRYLLLFPGMRRDDMTPMISVWPTIPQRLLRPKAKLPKAVKPNQTFHCAYQMEDMTAVLVAASGEPPRVRTSDFALFAKARQQLESNLMSIPDWLMQTLDSVFAEGNTPGERGARVHDAVDLLKGFQFLETRGTYGKDLRFEPTVAGQDWLGMSSKDRLKTILDRLKPDRPKNQQAKRRNLPDDAGIHTGDTEEAADPTLSMIESPLQYDTDDEAEFDYDYVPPFASYGHDDRLSFLPQTVSWGVDSIRDPDIPAAMIEAYGSLARRRFVQFSQFVTYHARQANPLLGRRPGAPPVKVQFGWSRRKPTDEEAEDIWGQSLLDFFYLRLLPLGCAKVGLVDTAGEFCIALTAAGRYLLGLAKDFDYGLKHDQQGHILVQPNFDVVFLSPAPLAEAAFARFADRKANGTGTLFKITKKSIFSAASCNMTAEQVLDTLRDLCTKAIPTNVAREVRDWFDQCGRVALNSTIVIRCPNAQVATRVLAAGGKKLTPISETVVELADRKFRASLVKKLKEAGVFVDQSSEPSAPQPKRRRRRRQW